MTVTEVFKWQDAAACRYGPLGLFFSPEGEQQHEKPEREAEAKKICARCPVRAACLEDALVNGIRFGVRRHRRRRAPGDTAQLRAQLGAAKARTAA
jgi:hypothetical protein